MGPKWNQSSPFIMCPFAWMSDSLSGSLFSSSNIFWTTGPVFIKLPMKDPSINFFLGLYKFNSINKQTNNLCLPWSHTKKMNTELKCATQSHQSPLVSITKYNRSVERGFEIQEKNISAQAVICHDSNRNCVWTVLVLFTSNKCTFILISQDWPDKGVVSFNKYSTRYREGLDLVVKDINCHVAGGEKVCFYILCVTWRFEWFLDILRLRKSNWNIRRSEPFREKKFIATLFSDNMALCSLVDYPYCWEK